MEGKITPGNKYVAHTTVSSYQVDVRKRMKPSSFMDLAQEMAYLAAGEMGFGYDDLQKDGTAWVLSRIRMEFLRMPSWNEKITLATWHKGLSGPFYLRDFTLKGEGGGLLVAATSSWVVLDVKERSLVRGDKVLQMVPPDTICSDNAIVEPAERVVMPRGVTPAPAGEHKVGYTDVDLLGHTNNARYVAWAMDCMDFDLLENKPVRSVCVAFNHETVPGQVVSLSKYGDGDNWYVEGESEKRQAFCVKIGF